jgi:DNA repair protein RadC
MKHALLAGATCFVLVHNHPSGSVRPSGADNELTQRVKRAGDTMNIRMIDHVILTDGDYYSYSENGKI